MHVHHRLLCAVLVGLFSVIGAMGLMDHDTREFYRFAEPIEHRYAEPIERRVDMQYTVVDTFTDGTTPFPSEFVLTLVKKGRDVSLTVSSDASVLALDTYLRSSTPLVPEAVRPCRLHCAMTTHFVTPVPHPHSTMVSPPSSPYASAGTATS